MNYSSAIFRDFGEDLGPVRAQPLESLESAQLRKMRYVNRCARESLRLDNMTTPT